MTFDFCETRDALNQAAIAREMPHVFGDASIHGPKRCRFRDEWEIDRESQFVNFALPCFEGVQISVDVITIL
ncbi:MAG: hypothetical protein Q8L05_09975 [Actinomycetota bacterium]|nr:hypothetical protein [Actinomycetota bacterium]MDP2289416.1 hypothetical protein [Actinomycetota bacterium]